jgi:DNA-binding IclR family transcriptional regulator
MTLVTVQSVARASRLLKVLATSPGYVPLAELAESTGLAKSTAHGLLQTLVRERLVEHDPKTRRYRLGSGVLLPVRVCERDDERSDRSQPA